MTIAGRGAAAPTGDRIDFVDDLRALAVVFMVMLHTLHGWLLPEMRTGVLWTLARLAGGLAAPLFFFLAGAGVVLATHADRGRAVSPSATMKALLIRGAIIAALGVGLRLSMWQIDWYGVLGAGSWRVLLPGSAGIGALVMAYGRWGPRPAAMAAAGAVLLALALTQVATLDADGVSGVLRGDVLSTLGACIAIMALLTRPRFVSARPWLLAAGALTVALAAPAVVDVARAALPAPVAGALVAEAGGEHAAHFPLIPWVGHALAGGAVGLWWIRARARRDLPTTLAALAALGALGALLTSESMPMCYRALAAFPALVPAARLTSRVGLILVLAGAVTLAPRLFECLRPLGRSSLLAYWLHLPFAFGLVSRPLARALSPAQWGIAFSALMVALLVITAIRWGRRPIRPSAPWGGGCVNVGDFTTGGDQTNRSSPLSTKQAVL